MNRNPYILPDYGKIPPQAVDCEEAVLGTILLYSDSINDVVSILSPEMFYKDAHRKIFTGAMEVFKKNNSVDLVTLTEKLRSVNELESVGGPVYLVQLTNRIYSDGQLEYYATIVKDKFIRRELIRHSIELQMQSFDDSLDLQDITDFAESGFIKIIDQTHKREPVKLGKLVDWFIDKIQKIINHEIKLIGVPSGFTNIDRSTGGFKNGELIIIAARPSMGKSALALQIALNNGRLDVPVSLFSCEMSGESIAQRSLSGVSNKTNIQLIKGECNIDTIIGQSQSLTELPVYIDDSSELTVMELRSKARKLILKHGVKMIIVDYLQLMKGEGKSREQEVSSISRGLKSIAKDLNIPVIALSQINRESEKRGEKRPQLSDLRESGAIEQDADIVIFVYRPAYYGLRSVIIGTSEESSSGLMELIIAKNRNGLVGSFFVKHNESFTEIKEEIDPF